MTSAEIRRVRAGDIEIAYETFGRPDDTPLLLVMGLATQMIGWPDDFCRGLAERGHYVVRFDNRDIGLSTHLAHAGTPDLMAVLGGDPSSVPYGLTAFADDTVGLLDALGLDSAHLVGVSLGGWWPSWSPSGTRNASAASPRSCRRPATPRSGRPRRRRSALCWLPRQETGRAPSSGQSTPTGSSAPPASSSTRPRCANARASASTAPTTRPGWSGSCAPSSPPPTGLTAPDRTDDLAKVGVPALVIHGAQDALIDVSGGRATAAAIPGSELMIVDGMGHDLPRDVWPTIIERISALVTWAEQKR